MKKLILIGFLSLLLAATAACGKDSPPPPDPDVTLSDTDETILGDDTGSETIPEPPDTTPVVSETLPSYNSPETLTETAESTETTPADTEEITTAEESTTAPETKAPITLPEPSDPSVPANICGVDVLNNMTRASGIASIVKNGSYIPVTPGGHDPYYYPFEQVTGGRYVAIRYRARNAENTSLQFYMGSSGISPVGEQGMLRTPVIADGAWHVAIFDTLPLIEAGIYDGSHVSFFRLDPLDCDYLLYVNGQPYYSGTDWARYPMPSGASIDIAYVGFMHTREAVELYESRPTHMVTHTQLKSHVDISADRGLSNATDYARLTVATAAEGYVTLLGTGEDAYVTAILPGTRDLTTTKLLAIKYRTTTAGIPGQVFVGSGSRWDGIGDNLTFNYIADGEWHLLLLDLSSVNDLTGDATFLRYDFFTVAKGRSIDIAYIAFFDSMTNAEIYDARLSTPEDGPSLLTTDKTTYRLGESVMVTARGEGREWVGLCRADSTIPIRWFYLGSVDGYVSVEPGTPFDLYGRANYTLGTDPSITPGVYTLYLLPANKTIESGAARARVEILITE